MQMSEVRIVHAKGATRGSCRWWELAFGMAAAGRESVANEAQHAIIRNQHKSFKLPRKKRNVHFECGQSKN